MTVTRTRKRLVRDSTRRPVRVSFILTVLGRLACAEKALDPIRTFRARLPLPVLTELAVVRRTDPRERNEQLTRTVTRPLLVARIPRLDAVHNPKARPLTSSQSASTRSSVSAVRLSRPPPQDTSPTVPSLVLSVSAPAPAATPSTFVLILSFSPRAPS